MNLSASSPGARRWRWCLMGRGAGAPAGDWESCHVETSGLRQGGPGGGRAIMRHIVSGEENGGCSKMWVNMATA